ncbi:MAG TPA: fasciclin domain-containing protein [Ilumatobacteraceae bacterium]|nr:fasciclin domain-containing protein [Ilumatobacteraceae bacterium]
MRTKKASASLAALGLAAILAVTACGDDNNDSAAAAPTITQAEPAATTTAAMAEQPSTIVDVAVGAGDFTVLVEAVKAAGLVETLSGPGPFTVFAPTDAAFVDALKSLGITKEQLLADKAKLTTILTYHVVPGEVMAADVLTMDGKDVATVAGPTVKVKVNGSTVMINDATVTTADVEASNGVIHVINGVLLPPSK